MKTEPNIPTDLFLVEGKAIETVLRKAVREALLMHKRAGNPIATWKEGRVVIVPPEEIELPEEDTPAT